MALPRRLPRVRRVDPRKHDYRDVEGARRFAYLREGLVVGDARRELGGVVRACGRDDVAVGDRVRTSHRKVRARVEHAFARMKAWKILRDCRLKGDGVHTAMLCIARMHNLALTG